MSKCMSSFELYLESKSNENKSSKLKELRGNLLKIAHGFLSENGYETIMFVSSGKCHEELLLIDKLLEKGMEIKNIIFLDIIYKLPDGIDTIKSIKETKLFKKISEKISKESEIYFYNYCSLLYKLKTHQINSIIGIQCQRMIAINTDKRSLLNIACEFSISHKLKDIKMLKFHLIRVDNFEYGHQILKFSDFGHIKINNTSFKEKYNHFLENIKEPDISNTESNITSFKNVFLYLGLLLNTSKNEKKHVSEIEKCFKNKEIPMEKIYQALKNIYETIKEKKGKGKNFKLHEIKFKELKEMIELKPYYDEELYNIIGLNKNNIKMSGGRKKTKSIKKKNLKRKTKKNKRK